ncbi:hypothetical protein M9H77_31304 [Catharanthus roseus]|uniref:Uncharacterized protein n=1 Tax=Catharanthus roseus TaxID=4058 RepID=A0ACB9ZZR9_CATRO|nr:hypothetical protein M9H77_31304 [Catharanthus roseus]
MITAVNHTKQRQKQKNREERGFESSLFRVRVDLNSSGSRTILFTITNHESETEMKDRTLLFYYKRIPSSSAASSQAWRQIMNRKPSLRRDPSDLGKDANRRCRTSAARSVSPSTAED